LPYAVSGWAGYRRHWCLQRRTNENDTVPLLSFADKKAFLASVVADLQANQAIRGIVTFDPPIPETNMIHGYLKHSVDACNEALLKTQARVGVEVLRRVRPISEDHPAYQAGYRSWFEWAIGENNAGIPKETFARGWSVLANELQGAVTSKLWKLLYKQLYLQVPRSGARLLELQLFVIVGVRIIQRFLMR
jgi:hypothetical protein